MLPVHKEKAGELQCFSKQKDNKVVNLYDSCAAVKSK